MVPSIELSSELAGKAGCAKLYVLLWHSERFHLAITQAEILQDELLGFLRESPSVASLVSRNQVDRNNPCKSLGSLSKR